MKNETHYDLIVIGSGAGLMVAQAAAGSGRRCALIEAAKLGGTCLNRGCIPSKVLVHPADLVREMEHARKTGVQMEIRSIDWQQISRRVWNKINENKEIEDSLSELTSLDIIHGSAHFTGEHDLVVDLNDSDESLALSADQILIAAGGRSLIPPIEGLEDAGYLTSESFFGAQYPEKPWSRLVIVGGGAIGCEFAHIFSALGTQVTLVEMQPRLAMIEEPEVSGLLQRQLEAGGVAVRTGYRALSASRKGDERQLTLSGPNGQLETVTADAIFVSSGIRSNADRLNLESIGLKLNPRGWIETDEYLRTSIPHIYAIGDINGRYQFRHKANYEADILIHNLFSESDPPRVASYAHVPWAIFTWPQIAHVGMTEEQARETYGRVMVGRHYYSMTANGYAMGYEPGDDDDGFVKMISDAEGTILGVHIIGPQAAVLIQSFVYLMNAGYTCRAKTDQLPFPHQTGSRFCLQADSIEAIDQSMVIHPALSEVAAWVTGELEWVESNDR